MRLRIVPAVMLILLLASVCTQATNGLPVPQFPKPTADAQVLLSMGWYNCTQAWYFCAATNNIRFAGFPTREGPPTLVPKLSSALVPRVPGGNIAAQPVYMVTNFQNPPIFSTAPGQATYSALWQVFTVTWKPGVTPRPICGAQPASASNPCGLPDSTQADIVATQIVLDCPILVLGPLVNPFPSSGPGYKIPQSGSIDPSIKAIFMPAWLVYCQNSVTKRVRTAFALITDVGDPALASVLGANLAPGLLNVPDADTDDFFVMRGPKPLSQLPVVADCPTGPGIYNENFNYSPVMRYIILRRNVPPSCLITTVGYIDMLLLNGGLQILKDDQRINAPVFVGG